VKITPSDQAANFEEFPDDPELRDFDPDDRKFVAVALAHQCKPPILQTVDTGWWLLRDAFRRNEVRVEFLCEDDIRRLAEGA
jgi:hypothetical protein